MNSLKLYEQFLLERSKNDPMPEVYQKKKLAVFLVGSPASGKSWFLNREITRKNRHFKVIDPDAKSHLLTKHLDKLKYTFKDRVAYTEYKDIITDRVEVFPRIRGLNREIEMQFEVLLHEGTNIIYDSTGNNTKLLTYFVDKCNEFDYDVMFLHVMGRNIDWQIQQSELRAAQTGRPVDEDYLRELYQKSQKMMAYYSTLDINNYYIIWNRGIDSKPKYYKFDNGVLLKRSGSRWKGATKSHKRRRRLVMNESNSNVLHAFDMDDTLIKSPKFSDFFSDGKLPGSDTEMGKVIDDELKEYGHSREDVEIQNKRITILDGPDHWETNENGRYVMPKPHGFYVTKDSLGKTTYPKIKEDFDKAENKCVITGRSEDLREDVEHHLYEMDLHTNRGVYLAPAKIKDSVAIAKWKASVLEDMCKEYSVVYYYEDKYSWVETIRETVDSTNLIIYHVQNGEIIKEY
ncbi:MAG: putative Pnkp1 [uncultured marine phage]|uniref:Putative Pnkp1 n=1 Tax=uncultured marine phage TaxID=707152 RepID=A0A8D9FQC3_9VIRU|nr:MAG: putative Pnkp1 [uncultured marine phage]